MKTYLKNKHYRMREQASKPVFIHSLWRAGSTYLFSVFRRSASGYWCYQEPIHEIALYSKNAPENLHSNVVVAPEVLRHPFLDKPYFKELFEAWPNWRDDIKKHSIYDAYFNEADNTDTIRYLNKIITSSKGRPVVQECRTSSRINSLKNALGGYHIYLWRNPWDQWWSYKATHYFDITSQLILNTTIHPEAITRLKQEIGFEEFHHEDLAQEISNFGENRLSAEHSYLAFYLLWCLGLLEGCTCADFLLNIDTLNDSEKYRDSTLKHLADCGVIGLDFSDCKIPQMYYSADETLFFTVLEDKIHGILLLSGYTTKQLTDLQVLRKNNAPKLWSLPMSDIPCEVMLPQAVRGRNVVIRTETEHAARLYRKNRQLVESCKRTAWLNDELDASKFREHNLIDQLDIEKGKVSRLHAELEELQGQLTAVRVHTQQKMKEKEEMISRQQLENAEREQALNSLLQNIYQAQLNLQEELLQSEHFISELHAENTREKQRVQEIKTETLKLHYEFKRQIDHLNTENKDYQREITICNEKIAKTQNFINDLVADFQLMPFPSTYSGSMISDDLPDFLFDDLSIYSAVSLNELLMFHDKKFIICAYQTLLGRAPDPAGFQYYLDRLRSGISKYEILAQLRFSKEGTYA